MAHILFGGRLYWGHNTTALGRHVVLDRNLLELHFGRRYIGTCW